MKQVTEAEWNPAHQSQGQIIGTIARSISVSSSSTQTHSSSTSSSIEVEEEAAGSRNHHVRGEHRPGRRRRGVPQSRQEPLRICRPRRFRSRTRGDQHHFCQGRSSVEPRNAGASKHRAGAADHFLGQKLAALPAVHQRRRPEQQRRRRGRDEPSSRAANASPPKADPPAAPAAHQRQGARDQCRLPNMRLGRCSSDWPAPAKQAQPNIEVQPRTARCSTSFSRAAAHC